MASKLARSGDFEGGVVSAVVVLLVLVVAEGNGCKA